MPGGLFKARQVEYKDWEVKWLGEGMRGNQVLILMLTLAWHILPGDVLKQATCA